MPSAGRCENLGRHIRSLRRQVWDLSRRGQVCSFGRHVRGWPLRHVRRLAASGGTAAAGVSGTASGSTGDSGAFTSATGGDCRAGRKRRRRGLQPSAESTVFDGVATARWRNGLDYSPRSPTNWMPADPASTGTPAELCSIRAQYQQRNHARHKPRGAGGADMTALAGRRLLVGRQRHGDRPRRSTSPSAPYPARGSTVLPS